MTDCTEGGHQGVMWGPSGGCQGGIRGQKQVVRCPSGPASGQHAICACLILTLHLLQAHITLLRSHWSRAYLLSSQVGDAWAGSEYKVRLLEALVTKLHAKLGVLAFRHNCAMAQHGRKLLNQVETR